MENGNQKVCIVTNYSSTGNFGALLQAYALNTYINRMGYETRTLYVKNDIPSLKQKYLDDVLHLNLRGLIRAIQKDLPGLRVRKEIQKRKGYLEKFRMSIPHTDKYISTNLNGLQDQFDVFIAGSDQIFRPNREGALVDYYWLKMVQNGAVKASYAASMGIEKLDERQEASAREALRSFDFISVREKPLADYFRDITGRSDVTWCIDPVFLFDQKDWEKVSERYPISGAYILVYIIKGNEALIESIRLFARKHGYQIVTFPSMGYIKNSFEDGFGDYRIYDATPEQFLYLMDHAAYVFTDSFHATAFSIIFHKKFFTSSANQIAFSRIRGLLDLFGAEERAIPDVGIANGEYSLECDLDWDNVDGVMEAQRERSHSYLTRILTYHPAVDRRRTE